MSDPLFDLKDRSILVAGAGGIGVPLAKALAERGARLVIADIVAEKAEAAAGELVRKGHAAVPFTFDVVKTADCEAVVKKTVDTHGRIDGLLNATGAYRIAETVNFDDDDWDINIDTNLTGAFRLARAAGRVMVKQKKGRIVTLASVSSRVSNPLYAAYAASKAGLAHVTRVMAVEWIRHGVTVNAIGPAVIPTPMIEPITRDPVMREGALARIPAGRFATTDDLVGATVYLMSDASAFMTGQVMYVDGGRTIS
ncbi:MAG: SDR family NAD(P)-dependent oxidoreductase [Hyphomicrobiales bacterium]